MSNHLAPDTASPTKLIDVSVQDLLDTLCKGAGEANPLALTGVKELLSRVRIDDASLQQYIHWKPRGYTRNLIYRDTRFELLTVCWEPGASSPIHDHAGQDCWLYVHAGALFIETYDLVDPTHRGCEGQGIGVRKRGDIERVEVGVVDHRGPVKDIHRVVNRRSLGQRAITVHIYAQPFDACVVYNASRRQARRVLLRYDTVGGRLV